MSASSNSGGGVGFTGLLALLFIGLKLGGIIDWSWLWVLAPLWIPLGIAGLILIVFGILVVVAAMVGK